MSNAHLYSVDSSGTATSPASGGSPPTSGGPTVDRPQRAKSKARPRYIVPTDRLKFAKQREALCAVAVLSRHGEDVVTGEAMASMMEVAPSTAPLNNAFFIDVGLMTKVGKGGYKPTEVALTFQREYSFDPEAAGKVLAPAFNDTWFYRVVKDKLAVTRQAVAHEAMIRSLASAAGTDNTYATQYGFLLEWLEYAGLISVTEGAVKLAEGNAAVRTDTSKESEPNLHGDHAQTLEGPQNDAKPQEEVVAPRPVISLAFEVSVTADDLGKLAADQITALFDGVGKVAALQAALRQQG